MLFKNRGRAEIFMATTDAAMKARETLPRDRSNLFWVSTYDGAVHEKFEGQKQQ